MEHSENTDIQKVNDVSHQDISPLSPEDVAIKSTDEINRLIKETEETLGALMNELKRRQMDKAHQDIDHLDEYMAEADTSFKALRRFIAMALQEIRGEK